MQTLKKVASMINATRKRIGLIGTTKFLFAKAVNRLTDPFAIASYSQFGEDRAIEIFFKNKSHGTYVDIGCNHPISYSNTRKLYLRGWKGLCIDANPSLVDIFKKARPKDIVLQEVISNRDTRIEFYFSKVSHLISGVGEKKIGNWKRTENNCNVVCYETTALSSLLLRHSIPYQFDLLSIDVEGHELEVLDSLDMSIFKPLLVVVEMHDFDIMNPGKNKVFSVLIEHDYFLMSYLNPNGFFALRNSSHG
jgi:FkbM family methyltransferase